MAEMTAPWKETALPTILSKYKLEEIYDANEFGLFYFMQPNKSLNIRSEACTAEKPIQEMDTKFTKEKKKEALIMDNSPAQPTIDNLKSRELIFLPPNTTSKLQPVDQGCKALALQKAGRVYR